MSACSGFRLTLIGIVLVGIGCSSGEEPQSRAPSTAEVPAGDVTGQPRPARVLALPGETSPAKPPSSVLEWEVPTDWIVEQPSSSMRLAQYRVPGPGGDGECVVFYFGPGQGGDPSANAVRWARQFSQPDGSSSLDVLQVNELPGTRMRVQLVEVTGTYDGGMTMTDAPAEKRPGYMLLGAIVEGQDAPWFFKFTGPEATVKAQRPAFVSMLESVDR